MALTQAQRIIAQQLRNVRPPVLYGTNAIIDDKQREKWYAAVSRALKQHDVRTMDRSAFCDIAGVPE